MKRDKNLAYRILKLCRDLTILSDSGRFEPEKMVVKLLEHKEFSDFTDVMDRIYFRYHYEMLDRMGCFIHYCEVDRNNPEIRNLSWYGHDLLETLERFHKSD